MTTTVLDGITVMVLDMKPKLGIRKQVKERALTGMCLHCDEEATRLGVCPRHYGQFRNALLNKPENEREVWRARQIREGKILASRQGIKIDPSNPFNEES